MPFSKIMQHYAETTPWELLQNYGAFKELQQPGKLLLGCKGRKIKGKIELDPNQPVYIDYTENSNNPPAILQIGKKGSGKTTLMTNLVLHQFYRMYKCNILIIDPKADLYPHKYPQNNPQYLKFLSNIGIPAKGIDLKIITPLMFQFSPKYINTDYYYGISMEDINGIKEFSIRRQMLAALLGITGASQDGSVRKLSEVMLQDPHSFEEMLAITKKLNLVSSWRKIAVFDNILNIRIAEGVLSDEHTIDVVDLMQKYPVILQCSLSETENINSTFVAFALAQIKEGFEAGRLKGNTVIVMDEADVLIPSGASNPPSKMFGEQMFTKWRSSGVIPYVIAQDPGRLSSTVLQQVDYILTPRIGYGTHESEFISKLFPDVNTFELSKLEYGKIDTYPKEWVVISPDEIQSFYPIYPPSLTKIKENI